MKPLLLLCLLAVARLSMAQETDTLTSKRLFNAAYVAVPLIAGGLLEQSIERDYRDKRKAPEPEHDYLLRNVTQYLPATAMFAMKAAGVPGRSSWERMLWSDAASGLLMVGLTQGLKHGTRIERPDGTDSHSFPSGHTAMAFMTATMLSKEYGHISPWISVGGYTVATTTGLLRVASNKHWISDVMVGAGIGILSTEFGYWIVDALMKDKGLNRTGRTDEIFDYGNPSFVSAYLAFNVPIGSYPLGSGAEFKTSAGSTIGVEGAWFPCRYIGIGGRGTYSSLHYVVDDSEASTSDLRYTSLAAGPYLSLPLTPRWLIGAKALLNYTVYSSLSVGNQDLDLADGFGFSTGLSLDYRVRERIAVGLFADYNRQAPFGGNNSKHLQTISVGFRAGIHF